MTIKINLVSIIIERDAVTKIPKDVWPWEVPIFRAQYGDSNVSIVNADKPNITEVDELPDAGEEYQRLRQQFGVDPDTKQSYADIVYGRGEPGVDAVEKAIKASKAKGVKAAVEGSQKVVDGGAVDKEKAQAREEAFVEETPVQADTRDDDGEPPAESATPVRIVADETKSGAGKK